MKIFLSAECESLGGDLFGRMQNIVQEGMLTLKEKEYGTELTNISIITILLQEKYFEDGGYPERRYFSRKNHYADIRLRMDLHRFLVSSPTVRYQLYCDHIIASVETLRRKVSKEFQFEQLLLDIKDVLLDPKIKAQCESLSRFP